MDSDDDNNSDHGHGPPRGSQGRAPNPWAPLPPIGASGGNATGGRATPAGRGTPVLLVPSSQPAVPAPSMLAPAATEHVPIPVLVQFATLQGLHPANGPNPAPSVAAQPIRGPSRSTWREDRARASTAPRQITGAMHDGLHLPGHDVHPWQVPIVGRVRRITWYEEYTPQIRDIMTVSDRLLGGSLQLWIGGRYDNGATNTPVAETFVSRLLWDTGYMPIIQGMISLFENAVLAAFSNDMTAFRDARNEGSGSGARTSHASVVTFDPRNFWPAANLILGSQETRTEESNRRTTRSMTQQSSQAAATQARTTSTSSTSSAATMPSTPTPSGSKGKGKAKAKGHSMTQSTSVEMLPAPSTPRQVQSSPFTSTAVDSEPLTPSRSGSLAARLLSEGPRRLYGRMPEAPGPLPRVVTEVIASWLHQLEIVDRHTIRTIYDEIAHIYAWDPPRLWNERVTTLLSDARNSNALTPTSSASMASVFLQLVEDIVQVMQVEKLNAYYEGRA